MKVYIHGVPIDLQEKRTKTIQNNGLNPLWNEDLSFTINCPELAIIYLEVRDDDLGKDDSIGYYAIRFENMRPGYRHIPLRNQMSKGVLFVGIRIEPVHTRVGYKTDLEEVTYM